MRPTYLVAALLILGGPSTLDAQVQSRQRPGPGRRPLPNMPPPDGPQGQRMMLEQQIRQRLWQVAKRRLALTDDQMTKLEQVTTRFDQRRRQLGQEEKTHRQALRGEILADTSANQSAIATAIDQLQQIQRRRVDMQIEEQKEFAAFMTPLQRGRFMALQEEFRRRMQELMRARADGSPPPAFQSP